MTLETSKLLQQGGLLARNGSKLTELQQVASVADRLIDKKQKGDKNETRGDSKRAKEGFGDVKPRI